MRVALVSPFPPSKSGIADYSAALAASLNPLCGLETISSAEQISLLDTCDLPVYQIGNNDAHGFVYRAALRHPGVVVLHEANLHHLIAEITIKCGDWDAYLREVQFDGGAPALAYAQAVRRLEVGPDYDGVPMLRRVLQNAKGLVVHSHFVGRLAREQGFLGPLAVIPHGAWLPEPCGEPWRQKLGVGDEIPLVGIFGHLKPYKRIAESLRAFRRLVRRNPFARMILVGEEHPDFPLQPLIESLDLQASVRHIDFAPIEDFVGYMAACDIIVNLRYPTVGESSGSMLRALGLGKPVLVSDVGAFAEFPDDVCLKVPVGAPAEEDLIYEYLNYLCENPDAARLLGAAGRNWVADTCNWDRVAEQYLAFCEEVVAGQGDVTRMASQPESSTMAVSNQSAFSPIEPDSTEALSDLDGETPVSPLCTEDEASLPCLPEELPSSAADSDEGPELPYELPGASTAEPLSAEPDTSAVASAAMSEGEVKPDSPNEDFAVAGPSPDAHPLPQLETPLAQALLSWAPNSDARGYLMQHISRLEDTLKLLPDGGADKSILEMGCYMQLTPLLQEHKGYGEVRGCYYGPAGNHRQQTAHAPDGRTFSCIVDTFDAERDTYPYADERFDVVLCTELFEHLGHDPFHCLTEINRILKTGGHLLLSTPNVCSSRAIAAILTGYHPGFFPAFIRPTADGEVDPRHHREYAPREIRQALSDCGFTVDVLRTGAYWSAPAPENAWVEHLLDQYELDRNLRGECIFALGRKTGPAIDRYPAWLYYR